MLVGVFLSVLSCMETKTVSVRNVSALSSWVANKQSDRLRNTRYCLLSLGFISHYTLFENNLLIQNGMGRAVECFLICLKYDLGFSFCLLFLTNFGPVK